MLVIHKRVQDPPVVIELEDGRRIVIHIPSRVGDKIKLAFDAPRSILIHRDPDFEERRR